MDPDFGSGYVIENCNTGEQYTAIIAEAVTIGQVFATGFSPMATIDYTTYLGLSCYKVVEEYDGVFNFKYVNLPVLYIPYADFGECDVCNLWIHPQIWDTTQMEWDTTAFRTWGTV